MKNSIENILKNDNGQFDVEKTPQGHQNRFFEKLKAQEEVITIKNKKVTWWKPLTIAASFAVLFTVGSLFFNDNTVPQEAELASVSVEMQQTQSFFTTAINEELKTLKSYNDPELKEIINETLTEIEALEAQYKILKVDLLQSGNDKRVVTAMIANFQNRIELLQEVINTIEDIKNQKNNTDEITL
ncbi:hypothetical protein [Patiriisocius marinistellae]|nr:hypothetical protein [Patiriisocius marinistellae]